jgi:hypothetical protein
MEDYNRKTAPPASEALVRRGRLTMKRDLRTRLTSNPEATSKETTDR